MGTGHSSIPTSLPHSVLAFLHFIPILHTFLARWYFDNCDPFLSVCLHFPFMTQFKLYFVYFPKSLRLVLLSALNFVSYTTSVTIYSFLHPCLISSTGLKALREQASRFILLWKYCLTNCSGIAG